MPFGGHLQRRRAAIASWLALAVAVGGIVTYAVQADGYRAHTTELNDGGIWVTSNADGAYGRVNKPIGELDGTVFANIESTLDVVQDGSSVVGVDLSEGLVVPIDPAQMRTPDAAEASLPGNPVVGMAGGTLAVLDTATGRLWVTREDPKVGVPDVTALGEEGDPVATVGDDAALAVGLDGTVYAVSAAEDELVRLRRQGEVELAPGAPEPLPGAAFSDAIAVTAVGAVPVVLDAARGRLSVVGGPEVRVPRGSVLQQPGPSADEVLVAARDALLSVDLASGEITTVADGVGGDPANPVRLGDCRYGAWGGGASSVVTVCGAEGEGPVQPQGLGTDTRDLVFRTNRGQIVLNDRGTGHVWDVDSDRPTRLDNWDAFDLQSDDKDDEDDNQHQERADRRPPKARNDSLGARPGRTTILHLLDNDTAPSGRLLAIRSVRDISGADARLDISPDGQTVQISLPNDSRGGTTFEYFIDDGRQSVAAHATVRVAIVESQQANSEPRLRKDFEPRVWTVPASGTIDVPVLPDWRDPRDGDPVSTVSAAPVSGPVSGPAGGQARVTASGAVRFVAPPEGGTVQVQYAVSDGLGEPVSQMLDLRVQDPNALEPVAPTAQPDVIAGETGKPITITPLANDLPGADPRDPDAVLTLAAEVGNVPGAEVTTDLVKGTVTLRSETAQTYFLDYQAAYGTAETDTGKIRVDVRAPENPPLDPVAVPDTVTLFGQAASVVDVLANDVDPSGGLLSVERAEALSANQVDLAVVEGRWLRVSARQGQLSPNPQVIRYTITNGQRTATGQVVVGQRPPPADDTPVTQNDRVTVREGSSQAIAVLDNDYSPSGGTLTLVSGSGDEGDVVGAGRLDVQPLGPAGVDTGAAFVSGRTVRYVAPSDLRGPQRFTIRYQAANEQGDTATGKVRVTVLPVRLRTNSPPEPPVVEGRTVSGDTVTLRLPGYGVDPDGDPVTILGLDTAPSYGRVVRIGANSIEYSAYPDSHGTDEFRYRITDSLGATSTGVVRVSIARPGPPQPPLAVADSITVAPGRTAVVDVLANDLVAPGSRASVSLVDPPAGVRLLSASGPVEIDAPDRIDARSIEVVYRLTDGLDSSQTTVTLHTQDGYNNPPVVSDAFGSVGDGRSITADVLSAGTATSGSTTGAYDPDGPTEDLVVAAVYPPAGIEAGIDGAEITVERAEQPMVVPFRVEDAEGGAATGSLYVPAADSGLPFVRKNKILRVDPGDSRVVRLSDYVTNPSGGPLSFTLKSRMWASPRTQVQASVVDDDTFRVSADESYAGPAAVVFEVTTGTSVNDPDGLRAILSVPVQVGETRPILRCPEEPIDVPQAESVRLDIGAVCHVFTTPQALAANLVWAADFDEDSADGLSAVTGDDGVVAVTASAATSPGDTGTLRVAADDSDPGRIRFRVTRTPPPSLAPIRVTTLMAGESQTIDLRRYLSSEVSDPEPTVIDVRQLTDLPVRISSSGSEVTITAGALAHGRAVFRVEMSDVAGSSGPDRRVQGRIVVEILGVPDVPGVPVPGTKRLDSRVALDWRAPQANGAPIDFYEVRDQFGHVSRCQSNSCDITHLHNETAYRFSVRAHNAVGYSGWSGPSIPARPASPVNFFGQIDLVEAGDGYLKIAWPPAESKGGAVVFYSVRWRGGHMVTTVPRATIRHLDNHQKYVFEVMPRNVLALGASLESPPFQPVGTPSTPAPPTLTEQVTSGSAGAITLSWPEVDANGPKPATYTVYRDEEPISNCTRIQGRMCDITNITFNGHQYRYAVKATNAGGASSPLGPATTWKATGKPGPWGNWDVTPTGDNNEARASFTVPPTRGNDSIVRIFVDGAKVEQQQLLNKQDVVFQVPDNLGPHSVYLEVCNEDNACSQSTTQDVQTYGPLAASHIHRVTPNVNGSSISWTIEADSNGNQATLTVTSDKGRSEEFTVPVGVSTFTTQTLSPGYGVTENVTVTLSDANPDRGSVSTSASATTGGPPPPSVEGSKGAPCNDDASAGLQPCDTGLLPGPKCTDASCAFVHITLSDWRTDVPVVCSVNNNPGLPYDASFDSDSEHYYGKPGGTVTINCENVLGQSAQTSFTW